MKKVILIALTTAFASAAFADPVYVKPRVNKDGTYVQGHYRTSPNNTKTDNYSSRGNVNPYTGKEGKVDPYKPKKPKY